MDVLTNLTCDIRPPPPYSSPEPLGRGGVSVGGGGFKVNGLTHAKPLIALLWLDAFCVHERVNKEINGSASGYRGFGENRIIPCSNRLKL